MKISSFPNSTGNQVTIQSTSVISTIEVSDAAGRILFSLEPNLSLTQLNVASLSSGFYYVNARIENGITITEKFFRD